MKKDLTGMRFGRLVVIKATDERGPDGGVVWECQCDCGNTCKVWNNKLMRKKPKKSCGCLQLEAHTTYIHGGEGSILYHKWRGMLDRCNNPNSRQYKYYGARGISVCDAWKNDFTAFRAWAETSGYVGGLSIDRIDVNGDYSPGNCRWVSMTEQQKNKTSNIIITMDGESKTLADWSKRYGIPYATAWARIRVHGWTPERALKTPLRNISRRLPKILPE